MADMQRLWPVWWHGAISIHAVIGAASRVTVCGVDFISRDHVAFLPPITCKHCLELLECSPTVLANCI